MEDLVKEILKRLLSRLLQGTLTGILLMNFGCASAPVVSPEEEDRKIAEILAQYDEQGEKYQVGLAPWEVEARDARILKLEEQLEALSVDLSETKKELAKVLRSTIDLFKRQERINGKLAGGAE